MPNCNSVVIIAFDDFTDIDVFLMWDLLNRVAVEGWQVQIVGSHDCHTSSTGIPIPMHDQLERAREAQAVLFASGRGTRQVIQDASYLERLQLDPSRQLIGSMCSGALILAQLGFLTGKDATTYPTAKTALEAYGVRVIEKPFVQQGNIATAAGCLAAQYLVGWVIETLVDKATREKVLEYIQPVGEGLFFNTVKS